jgi:hypothetical protein
MHPAAGLGFRMPGNPGSDVEFLIAGQDSIPLPAHSGACQPSGEEKECAAICHHLLPWMKVAVRAAKQDVHIVPIGLARARATMHTERTHLGVSTGN